MLGYDNTFNDDYRIFEKINFLKFKNWRKKQKIEDFTKNPCPNQRIVLLGETSF